MIEAVLFLLGLAIGLAIAPQSVAQERIQLVKEKLKERQGKPEVIDFEDERRQEEIEKALGIYEPTNEDTL